MKCFNCNNDAHYYVNDQVASEAYYCDICLPGWLRIRAAEGHFALPVAEAKPAKAKSSDAPAETTPSESN